MPEMPRRANHAKAMRKRAQVRGLKQRRVTHRLTKEQSAAREKAFCELLESCKRLVDAFIEKWK